jgi:Tfp pilus assembly PilM family ATPase
MPDTKEQKKSKFVESTKAFLHSLKKLSLKKHLGFGRIIGIFVDEYAIHLAVATRFFNSHRLLNVTKIYIPSAYDSPEKRQNFISSEIENYTREFHRPLAKIIIGVGGTESAIRVLTLPKMSKQELTSAIYWEGNKQIPFGLEESFYGHHIIHSDMDGRNGNISACLIAVSKKEIHNCLDRVRISSRIDGIYFDLESIGYMLRYVDDFSPTKTYVLINIKKHHTEISFYKGTRLEFKHISSLGSSAMKGGFGDEDSLNTFTETLAQEIQNTLDFYVGQFSRASTDIAYVYGDLSYSEDLVDRLSARFGIEFKRFPISYWKKTQPKDDDVLDQIPVLLNAVSLALIDEKPIDFIPPYLKEARAIRKFYQWAAPAFAIFIIALLANWMTLKNDVDMDKTLLISATNEIEEFVHSPAYIMYSKVKQRLAADQALLQKLEHEPTYLHLNLKELSHLTPNGIYLDNYELEGSGEEYVLTLGGKVYSAGTPPEVTLAEYVARLEGSPFFEKVRLKKYAKKFEGDGYVLDFLLQTDAII